ncbi:hypothetical protein I8748_31350 [Nostoc sp. CENA67]|uniref:Uncharacterized protein n=1 Tax=Amazonocrinis nigriterrae CENA67 TaxID=2794033 RepID=A0A8J7I075_9NOST|nr:hypothetical protein [Amazonocrinis nigriterrae CENA67]
MTRPLAKVVLSVLFFARQSPQVGKPAHGAALSLRLCVKQKKIYARSLLMMVR